MTECSANYLKHCTMVVACLKIFKISKTFIKLTRTFHHFSTHFQVRNHVSSCAKMSFNRKNNQFCDNNKYWTVRSTPFIVYVGSKLHRKQASRETQKLFFFKFKKWSFSTLLLALFQIYTKWVIPNMVSSMNHALPTTPH